MEFWVLPSTKKIGWQYFKKLVACNSISEDTKRSLKPVRTRPGRVYGLYKVHKDIIDNCPPFRTILSAINTPT